MESGWGCALIAIRWWWCILFAVSALPARLPLGQLLQAGLLFCSHHDCLPKFTLPNLSEDGWFWYWWNALNRYGEVPGQDAQGVHWHCRRPLRCRISPRFQTNTPCCATRSYCSSSAHHDDVDNRTRLPCWSAFSSSRKNASLNSMSPASRITVRGEQSGRHIRQQHIVISP